MMMILRDYLKEITAPLRLNEDMADRSRQIESPRGKTDLRRNFNQISKLSCIKVLYLNYIMIDVYCDILRYQQVLCFVCCNDQIMMYLNINDLVIAALFFNTDEYYPLK